MKKTMLRFFFLALAATSFLTVNAFADTMNFNLTMPVQTAAAGSTVSFQAIAAAPGSNAATLYLNADSYTFAAPPAFTLDDGGFFSGFPLTLSPGDSFTGLLFMVNLPSNAAAGLYPGTFSILGGPDSSSSDTLGTAAFNVDIPNSTAPPVPVPVPEPSSLILMAAALPGMWLLLRRGPARRRA
jgi:hypothetical protein